jgi:hypothetical protein
VGNHELSRGSSTYLAHLVRELRAAGAGGALERVRLVPDHVRLVRLEGVHQPLEVRREVVHEVQEDLGEGRVAPEVLLDGAHDVHRGGLRATRAFKVTCVDSLGFNSLP